MVPSRGGADMVTGLLTGTTTIAIVGLPNFTRHIRSGAVKALAVDSEKRSPLFPDVPTLGELGFPNLAPVFFEFVGRAHCQTDRPEKLYRTSSRSATTRRFAISAFWTSASCRYSTRPNSSTLTSRRNAQRHRDDRGFPSSAATTAGRSAETGHRPSLAHSCSSITCNSANNTVSKSPKLHPEASPGVRPQMRHRRGHWIFPAWQLSVLPFDARRSDGKLKLDENHDSIVPAASLAFGFVCISLSAQATGGFACRPQDRRTC